MKKLIINLVCICILVVAVAATEVNINNNNNNAWIASTADTVVESTIDEYNDSVVRVIDIVEKMNGGVVHGNYFVKDIDTLDIVSVTEPEDEWLYEPVVGIAPSDDSYAICIFINK